MPQSTKVTQEQTYEVLWPLGRSAYSPFALNKRLPDLNGKVVGEVWDRVFRGEDIFPALRVALKERFPGVKIIEYTEFGDTHGPRQKEAVAELPALLKKYEVDAVISGVGA